MMTLNMILIIISAVLFVALLFAWAWRGDRAAREYSWLDGLLDSPSLRTNPFLAEMSLKPSRWNNRAYLIQAREYLVNSLYRVYWNHPHGPWRARTQWNNYLAALDAVWIYTDRISQLAAE